MAPDKNCQRSTNNHQLLRNGHYQGTANSANVGHIPAASNNNPSLPQPSQSSTRGATQQNTPASNEAQVSGRATFQPILRPWEHGTDNSNTSGATNGATPMERWQNESIQEQPWNGIQGVYLRDEKDTDMNQGNNSMNDDGQDGHA